mgnify:CR=1 FL=1
MSSIQEMGVQFIQYLQTFHPQLDGVMGFFAILVKPEYFLVFVFPVLYWNFGHRFFIKLIIVILADILIGESLRILLAQPRPWWIAEMVPIDAVTSVYSSPAGYSSFSVLFFGYIAYHLKRRWVTLTCFFIIIATSIAKLYEAATLLDHLLLGSIQGGIILYLFIKYGDKVTDMWIKLKKNKAVFYCLLIGVGVYTITYLITLLQTTYDLPTYIIKYKIIPSDRLANGATGFVTGFLISSLLSLRDQKFNHLYSKLNVKLWKRILVTIVGLFVVFLLFTIIRTTLINLFNNDFIIGTINLLIALIVGFWIYFYVPKFLNKE